MIPLESTLTEWNERRLELFRQRQLLETRNLRSIGLSDAAVQIYQQRMARIAANLESVLSRKPKLARQAARLFR